eukprot:CAMPEP_0202809392 /NCGR_PEP_ID=MMETSP1389-20130828/1704_1 /ASSEMBLY_ACC=CAM_ASM_000865 /TAXON_ID=302021 /ORGANISM="Rhodomonas sp., Strain CCMP768" /LENGTH=248 /DNA_ID=CAMNT_0049479969 /DNA_START=17 /DNA_END=763 /DNA_ORIENTATION=-
MVSETVDFITQREEQDHFSYLSADEDDESPEDEALGFTVGPRRLSKEFAGRSNLPEQGAESDKSELIKDFAVSHSLSRAEDSCAHRAVSRSHETPEEEVALSWEQSRKVKTAPGKFSSRSMYNRKIGAHLHTIMMEQISKQLKDELDAKISEPPVAHLEQGNDSPPLPPPQSFSRRQRAVLSSEEKEAQWQARREHRARHNRLVGAWLHEHAVTSYFDIVQKFSALSLPSGNQDDHSHDSEDCEVKTT